MEKKTTYTKGFDPNEAKETNLIDVINFLVEENNKKDKDLKNLRIAVTINSIAIIIHLITEYL